MPAGLQVFDSTGALQLEISDRVYRVLQIAAIPTTEAGSISVPELVTGTPIISTVTLTQGRVRPSLTVVGTNVNWNYSGVSAGDRDSNFNIMIAVF